MFSLEQQLEFAKSIDLSELFRHTELYTGTVLSFAEPEMREACADRGKIYISCNSKDILSDCGIFGKALKSCIVEVSGGFFMHGEDPAWGFRMSLRYDHKGGGYNGMELFGASYIGGVWTFGK